MSPQRLVDVTMLIAVGVIIGLLIFAFLGRHA